MKSESLGYSDEMLITMIIFQFPYGLLFKLPRQSFPDVKNENMNCILVYDN